MADARFAMEASRPARLLAWVRVLAFAVLFVAANFAMHVYDKPLHRGIKTAEGHFLLEMIILGLAAAVLTWAMAWPGGRSFASYGLGGPRILRNAVLGIVCGVAFLGGQLGLMSALGVFTFGWARPVDAALLSDAGFLALTFFAIGFTEEILFRGYGLVELSRALSFWPAAGMLAMLFGIPHWLKGGGENLLGGAQAALFGFLMAYVFLRTGSLWLGIGFHAGWDWAESFLFGVPDSATVSAARFLHPHIQGPDWLSGGAVGPEGSILTLLPLIAFALLVHALPPAKAD
jgi:CAAX protease family protein